MARIRFRLLLLVLGLGLALAPSSSTAEDEPATGVQLLERLAHLVAHAGWNRDQRAIAENAGEVMAQRFPEVENLATWFQDGHSLTATMAQLKAHVLITVLRFDTPEHAQAVARGMEAMFRGAHAAEGDASSTIEPGSGAGDDIPGFRVHMGRGSDRPTQGTVAVIGPYVVGFEVTSTPFVDAKAQAAALRDAAVFHKAPAAAGKPPAAPSPATALRLIILRVVDPLGQPVPRFQFAVAENPAGEMRLALDGARTGKGPAHTVAVEPGKGSVRVWGAARGDGKPLALGPSAAVPYGPDTKELEVTLVQGATMSGRVLEHDGTPAEGIAIAAHWRRGADSLRDGFPFRIVHATTTTDAEGRFAFRTLARGGEYDLALTRGGRKAIATEPLHFAGQDDVEIKLPVNRVIRLRFEDPDGKPVPLIYVSVWGSAGGEFLDATGVTDMEGRVELEGLDPSGRYNMDVDMRRAGRASPVANLNRSKWKPEDGVIRMERGWTLRGTVRNRVGDTGSYPILVKDHFDRLGQPSASKDGSFAIPGLPMKAVDVAPVEDLMRSVRTGATWTWTRIEPTDEPVELITVEVVVPKAPKDDKEAKKDGE